MKLDYKLIGHRIHILRKRRKLSQAALAESTGYSVPYISHIETGIKRASLEAVVKIADALGCTADQLLYGNQIYDDKTYLKEAMEILSDCTPSERQFLLELLGAIKRCVWYNMPVSKDHPKWNG